MPQEFWKATTLRSQCTRTATQIFVRNRMKQISHIHWKRITNGHANGHNQRKPPRQNFLHRDPAILCLLRCFCTKRLTWCCHEPVSLTIRLNRELSLWVNTVKKISRLPILDWLIDFASLSRDNSLHKAEALAFTFAATPSWVKSSFGQPDGPFHCRSVTARREILLLCLLAASQVIVLEILHSALGSLRGHWRPVLRRPQQAVHALQQAAFSVLFLCLIRNAPV